MNMMFGTGVFGLLQLLLLMGAADVANGGTPRLVRGPRGVRYPRAVVHRRDMTGVTYTTSSENSAADASFGTSDQLSTVNAGITQWLSGSGTHNFYGNVNCYGTVIASQTDALKTSSESGQTCDYSGHDTSNGNLYLGVGALISLNDYGSTSAPTYDWDLRTFTNYGHLQMCGRGDTGGSTYQLYCDIDCYNYGLIEMAQYYGYLGASFVWRNTNLVAPGATSSYNCYNDGTFRIANVVYHNVQNVYGNGCYDIGINGTLYLEDGSGYYQNVNLGPTFPNQTITFSDTNGCLHMDTQVYSHNSNFGPQVYGYGPGHAIEFYETFSSTAPYTYDATGGILTVSLNSGNLCRIKIGTGYDASLFYTASNPTHYNTAGYNAIFYRGTTPSQTSPSACTVAASATCTNPAATATIVSSSTATGYVTTTVAYSGSGTITGPVTTTIAASGTQEGTVEVQTLAPYVTATTNSPGVTAPYTTTIPQVGTTPGTVLEVDPATYVTSTATSNVNSAYTTTVPPSGTTPGTVIVVTPSPSSSSTTRPSVISTTIGANQCVCRPRS